ncbi:MAG TPA: cyclodeaminase/cyclohydrolase family protein [Segeticoccus sp.]|nr:cyclodeaminase/cyclohydrolase family protein [Segeticoccus sp.]
MGRYFDESLAGFADLVAQPEPSPAAGSVAAAGVALAAALATKAARLSSRQVPEAAAVAEDLERRRVTAGELADEDARSYGAVLDAIRREGRDSAASRTAWEEAARVPLTIVEVGSAVADHAVRLARDGNPNLRGDAYTALRLAQAAVDAAAQLVAINVAEAGLDPVVSDRASALAERVAALT